MRESTSAQGPGITYTEEEAHDESGKEYIFTAAKRSNINNDVVSIQVDTGLVPLSDATGFSFLKGC